MHSNYYKLYTIANYKESISSMQSEYEFHGLLLEIKQFLSRHNQLQGAFNLLARLDSYLETVIRKQSGQSAELIELISDSESEKQDGVVRISPRKFANILDIFVLDYNFEGKGYEVIGINESVKGELDNDRRAIMQLVLCPIKQHMVQKQRTSSMTQLHKLTSNIPKSSPVLILPNYSFEPFKYTYIYETKQCMEYNNKYYLVDRYYCFLIDGLANQAVNSIFIKFKNCIFQEKLKCMQDPTQASWKGSRQCLRAIVPLLIDKANELTINLSIPQPSLWVQTQTQFYLEPLKQTVNCSLLLLITYLSISQFKLIFYLQKEQKHLLSDIILSLQQSLYPLKYIYPVVFCSLNSNHCDFIQSPVPLTIGYWGSDKRKVKFGNQMQEYVNGESGKSMGTVVVDLSKGKPKIRCISGVEVEDMYILEEMQKQMRKSIKGRFMWQKISGFVEKTMEGMGTKNKVQKIQWIKMLENKIEHCQMYQVYTGS